MISIGIREKIILFHGPREVFSMTRIDIHGWCRVECVQSSIGVHMFDETIEIFEPRVGILEGAMYTCESHALCIIYMYVLHAT